MLRAAGAEHDRLRNLKLIDQITLQIEPPRAVDCQRSRETRVAAGRIAADRGGEGGGGQPFEPGIAAGKPELPLPLGGDFRKQRPGQFPQRTAAVAQADRAGGEQRRKVKLLTLWRVGETEHEVGERQIDRFKFAGGGATFGKWLFHDSSGLINASSAVTSSKSGRVKNTPSPLGGCPARMPRRKR